MIIQSQPAIRPFAPIRPQPAFVAEASPAEHPADTAQISRDPGPINWKAAPLAGAQTRLANKAAGQSAPLFGVGGLIFPDSTGKIKEMALQLGNVEFKKPLPEETHNGLLGVWNQLFTHMPETHFTVVCADQRGIDDVNKLVRDSGTDPARVSVVPAQAEQMSIWIRDSMLPVRAEDGHTKLLIQDRTYWPGAGDNTIAPTLAQVHGEDEHNPITSQQHPALRIDGGNILSNSKQIIVGSDSIRHTRARLQELYQDPAKAKEIEEFYSRASGQSPEDKDQMWEQLPSLVFQSEFGKPVLVIARDHDQPAFHIDMTCTPIGDKKFLVGDPSLAIKALKALSPEEREATNKAMAANAGITSGEDLVGKLIAAENTAENQANYDAVAAELKDAGYEIERMPALMGLRTTWSVPYLTYNNCIMERYPGSDGQEVKKVYLPQYGCEVLDKMAENIYQGNGYEVIPLQMGSISKLEGAIRCSSYAIEREF
ncbi:hypothetical protein JST97_21635 [bacterium]|nr:hypothetical protein [bacterium]